MEPASSRVNLGARAYDIAIGQHCLPALPEFVRHRVRGKRIFLVTDDHVALYAALIANGLQSAGFQVDTAQRPPGESQKSLAGAAPLYDRLAETNADRSTVVLAVGGGVIGDLAGFVAATYARGLPLLMVPTTLLAMVDSSVGGKVGINHPRAKNLIGAFYQPKGVWIDLQALETLPEREFQSGLAEVIKYGVILDVGLFEYLENHLEEISRRAAGALIHVVTRCCRLKAAIIEQDEREESGQRAVLNFGHTFAHAFEAVAGYGTLLHGEAVAAGMVCAALLAEHRGMTGPDLRGRLVGLLERFHLPTAPDHWPANELIAAMRNDKKTLGGQLRFVLPRRLGQVEIVNDVTEEDVALILRSSGST